ncbi:hypothetical protein H8K32_06660 [Undibacterium jejuense]|uniref:Uncharacterized protein n=1 Tax=Undibacterium jejuense TaxID=1344949 RepID=A0A923HNB0_9BURK|nr:hypothetical protein [Undibacterium jejuense]MBC3861773.1 hypothetical protein [Undibacterium jejuense]
MKMEFGFYINGAVMHECKLCLSSVQKLKDPHIIPRSTHKFVKDQSGRNIRFVLPDIKLQLDNQSDLKEYMLCEACELKFSKFENIGITSLKKVWNNYSVKKGYAFSSNEVIDISCLIHSIFWRASVSQLLSNFKLPIEQENLLQTSLNNGDAIQLPNLAIKISLLSNLKLDGYNNQLIISPWREKYVANIYASYFSFYGLLITMFDPGCLSPNHEVGVYLDTTQQSGKVNLADNYEIEIMAGILARMKKQAQ